MHNQLEGYLKQIESQLKALPPDKQQEELREIEQHLQSMVAGYIELGDTEEEAIASALRQFGNPKKVGRGLQKACSDPGERLPRIFAAGLCAFFCHWILVYLYVLCIGWIFNLLFHPRSWLFRHFDGSLLLFEFVIWGWMCIVAAFIAGRIGGAIAPRKAVLGILAIYTEVALCALAIVTSESFILPFAAMTTFACIGALSRGRWKSKLEDRFRILRDARERKLLVAIEPELLEAESALKKE